MEDIEVKIVSVELKSLNEKVERGFSDIKELIKSNAITLNEHIKEDKDKFAELDHELETLKIDMAKFKERWLLIGGGVSLFGSIVIELATHLLK